MNLKKVYIYSNMTAQRAQDKVNAKIAEAIIEKAEEFGLDLENDISVGDENKFKKYLPEKKEES